ncbi:MAG TPA: NAD-dependent epimerase/dehydratase family protein, partial [Ilumatobacter sp.]|nr:NAD-dependent epimerase/dehydratase family protein [Ilumatobacter sp.]
GASVRVVDALVPDHGGRADHLDGVAVEAVLVSDLAGPLVGDLVDGADVVFNVAGQVSHTASMRDPQRDLYLNATNHATFLDTVRRVVPDARIVYTSTRQVYGRSTAEVVFESHPANPVDVNGVAKLAGEQLHMVYAHAYGLACTALRLTNVYGPRQRLTSDELGFLPVFLRRALQGEEILIYGDGRQRRDCLHVDDVIAALLASVDDRAVGHVFNVGHPSTYALHEIASMIVAAAGSTGGVRLVPWPDDHARIDIGSFHTGSARIAEVLGWRATIELDAGIRDTIAFYREHACYLSST